MQKLPLRVLMISSIFYPKVDGTVVAVSNLLRCLQEHGCILCLITRKFSGGVPTEGWQNISVVRVGPSFKSPISRLMLTLNQVRAGFSLMRRERVDVIHAHGAHSLLAGLILGKLFHKPVVVTFHGFQRLWLKGVRWRSELNLALTYPIYKMLINSANAIIAQSHTLRKVITQLYEINPDKIHVVPHVIDEGRFKFVLNPPSVEPTVLSVGSLTRVHGFDIFIKAAALILKEISRAKFVIVGAGPQEENLRSLIKNLDLENSFFLVGPVFNQRKLAEYYASASVVVIPIKYKGYILSLVALEAMSTGRPVVTTMTLDHGLRKYGVYQVGFDPTELAQTIKELLFLNEKEYSSLAASAREYVEKQCSKKVVASQVENLYRKLIRNARAHSAC